MFRAVNTYLHAVAPHARRKENGTTRRNEQRDTDSEVSCTWISEYGILQNNDLFGLWKAGS